MKNKSKKIMQKIMQRYTDEQGWNADTQNQIMIDFLDEVSITYPPLFNEFKKYLEERIIS